MDRNRPDTELLDSFNGRLDVIRDRTRGVANRYYTSTYIVGRPGTSKTFTVKQELDELDVPYVIRNARMTGMGLFDLLHDNPEHVIVLDDIATLFKDPAALQILMAALDGDAKEPRTVTYKSKDKDISFDFMGGVIAISNLPLANDSLAVAISSRVMLLEHEPSEPEVAAFIRHLALNGYKELSADQCSEVVEFVIDEIRASGRRLDLRHMTKAYEDRRQWENGDAATNWMNLVRTNLQKMMRTELVVPSKWEQMEDERTRVREAVALYPGDTRRQMDSVGLKKSTFYKRLREVQA